MARAINAVILWLSTIGLSTCFSIATEAKIAANPNLQENDVFKLLSSLTAKGPIETRSSSCGESSLTTLVQRHSSAQFASAAPSDFANIPRSGLKYRWAISKHSKQARGNSQYAAKAKFAFHSGAKDQWAKSAPFDHTNAISNGAIGWHVHAPKDTSRVILELPVTMELKHYTILTRVDCCEEKFPLQWDLFCVKQTADIDVRNVAKLLDHQSNQMLSSSQCKIFPANIPTTPCKTLAFSSKRLDMLSELTLYGLPAEGAWNL